MMDTLFTRVTQPLRNQYLKLLERELVGSCESLLDVGCGDQSPIEPFAKRIRQTIGIDGFEPSIRSSQSRGVHNEYHLMNILDIGTRFQRGSFDAVVASEVIEHL